MNSVEGKPGHGSSSAERTREKRRRSGRDPEAQGKDPISQSGESCLLGFRGSTCREKAKCLDLGGPGLPELGKDGHVTGHVVKMSSAT